MKPSYLEQYCRDQISEIVNYIRGMRHDTPEDVAQMRELESEVLYWFDNLRFAETVRRRP